jgi:hypothetical protein
MLMEWNVLTIRGKISDWQNYMKLYKNNSELPLTSLADVYSQIARQVLVPIKGNQNRQK